MEQAGWIRKALRILAERCPRLAAECYWAGTSAISIEELDHRASFDLDFHTRRALEDVRPLLAEIQRAFPGHFELVQAPDEFGSGFRGVLELADGSITIEAMSNYDDVRDSDLTRSSTAPAFRRVTLSRYLADKIQCVVERVEARDLFDIHSVLQQHPELIPAARRIVAEQDPLLLAERLLSWSTPALERDLLAYPGVSPEDAERARDLLLAWLREEGDPE